MTSSSGSLDAALGNAGTTTVVTPGPPGLLPVRHRSLSRLTRAWAPARTSGPVRGVEENTMTALLTTYVLVWPIIVLGVLLIVVGAFVRDVRKARREGRRVI